MTAAAFEMAERNGDRALLCELHRLSGRVFETAQRMVDAEESYERAIRLARGQRAKSLELRATTDLGRLWAGRGAMAQAAALLEPLCDFFVEGLTNQDLVDARSLIERCASGLGSRKLREPKQ